MTIKKGSWFSAARHRSTLREYSKKIQNQASSNITKAEIIDYIEKGGSVNLLKSYDKTRDFFVASPQHSLLSTFVKKRFSYHDEPVDDRIAILKVLLNAGADPNFFVPSNTLGEYLAPVLHACITDDIDALSVFIRYQANLKLRQKTYIREHGPCLASANSVKTLDWLLENGEDIHFQDTEGRNLLYLAIEHSDSLEKVNWLLTKGISANEQGNDGGTASERVDDFIYLHQSKIKSYEVEAEKSAQKKEEYSVYIEEEIERLKNLNQLKSLLLSFSS